MLLQFLLVSWTSLLISPCNSIKFRRRDPYQLYPVDADIIAYKIRLHIAQRIQPRVTYQPQSWDTFFTLASGPNLHAFSRLSLYGRDSSGKCTGSPCPLYMPGTVLRRAFEFLADCIADETRRGLYGHIFATMGIIGIDYAGPVSSSRLSREEF